MKCEVSIVVKI